MGAWIIKGLLRNHQSSVLQHHIQINNLKPQKEEVISLSHTANVTWFPILKHTVLKKQIRCVCVPTHLYESKWLNLSRPEFLCLKKQGSR